LNKTIYGTALITGCGGDLAISLSKIARRRGIFKKIIGVDCSVDHPGDLFFDGCGQIPSANHDNYFSSIEEIVKLQKVDLIIPATDSEIEVFFENNFHNCFLGTPLVMSSKRAIEIGLSKLVTAKTIQNMGLRAPWTIRTSEGEPPEFPCIIKPIKSAGSQGVRILNDASKITDEDLSEDLVWQELIGTPDEEYTSGLYRDINGEVRYITFRRHLSGGITTRAILVDDSAINQMLYTIATKLELIGSINVQFRMTSDGPVVFEINPRFSSTVGFRDKLGFQDFIWSVLQGKGLPLPAYKPEVGDIRLYKTFQDQIIYPALKENDVKV
jgi:carbamoyl-phosphate synthase large subunit